MLYDPLTYDNLMMGLVVHFQKQPQHSLDEAASGAPDRLGARRVQPAVVGSGQYERGRRAA